MLFQNIRRQTSSTPLRAVPDRCDRIRLCGMGLRPAMLLAGAVLTPALLAQVITMDTRTAEPPQGLGQPWIGGSSRSLPRMCRCPTPNLIPRPASN